MIRFVLCRVGDAGLKESLATLGAGATAAAVVLAATIARIGLAIVDAHLRATAHDVGLADVGVGSHKGDTLVGAGLHGGVHSGDELWTAIWIYGVVAAVIGYKHTFKTPALGEAAGYAEHDAIAEGDHRRMHIAVVVVSVGDGIGTTEQRRLEILGHKGQLDDQMLDAEQRAMMPRTSYFVCGMVATIIESNGERDSFALLVEQCGRVEPTGIDDYRIFFCHILVLLKGVVKKTPDLYSG